MKKRGFTLIEVLAVIIILGILATITSPIVAGVIRDSKKKSYDHQLEEIYHAAEIYFMENGMTIDTGEKRYVTIYELASGGYLDTVPKDSVNGGKMDGIVEATGTETNNTYQYLTSTTSSNTGQIVGVDKNKTIKSIVVDGKSVYANDNNFEALANEVVEKREEAEIMTLEGSEALVGINSSMHNTRTEWFRYAFKANTAYTFTIESRAIAATSMDTKYYPLMRFVYTDGTYSGYNRIGKHTDTKFTQYQFTSDASKTLKAIQFSYNTPSPYKYAFKISSFKLSPTESPTPDFPKTIKNTGDDRVLNLKIVEKDGTVVTKSIALSEPLRSIDGTSIKDQIIINANGTVQVKRNVGVAKLDGSQTGSIYPDSTTSDGKLHSIFYNIFDGKRISGTLDVMSPILPYVKWNWTNTVTTIGISATDYAASFNYVYLKVSKEEFPTDESLTNWLKDHPTDVYFQLATPVTETLSSVSFDASNVKYVYVDSNLLPTVTVNY